MAASARSAAYPDQGPLNSVDTVGFRLFPEESLVLSQASSTITPTVWGRAFVAVLWIASGLLAAYFMKRRGHEFRSLAAVAFALGPLYIPLAIEYRRSEQDIQPLRLAKGRSSGGSVDVLIGLRGTADNFSPALKVLALLGPRIGRVTIAAAVAYETAGCQDWCEAKSSAATELELAASVAGMYCRPETVLVPGLPYQAFVKYAQQRGHHLVLITHDGRATGAEGALTAIPVSEDPTQVW